MATPVSRLPLTERQRPNHLSELVGNLRGRSDLRDWAARWQEGVPRGRRAAMLIGPPGVGKTTAALALARDLNWACVEMNASEARNQTALEHVAGRASVSQGLDATPGGGGTRRTLIVLDEADCLSGRAVESDRPRADALSLREFLQRRYRTVDALNHAWGLTPEGKPRAFADWASVPRTGSRAAWTSLPAIRRDLDDWKGSSSSSDQSDRGGLATIARLVRSTLQPVLLIVNDERPLSRYSPVFRSEVARIRFYPLRDTEVAQRVGAVARQEGIPLGPGVLEAIVGRARGDLRAALNDLDAIAPLPPGPSQREALGTRDLASDFGEFTGEVLSRPRYYRSVEVQDRLDATPDDLLPWVEENIDRFADSSAHREEGFAVLAVADLFLVRARRARVYGLWSYASELLSGGVGLALRDGPLARPLEAQFPQFLGEMGRSKAHRAVRKAVALRLGHRLHLSERKSVTIVLPFVERLLGELVARRAEPRAGALARALVRELALGPEELTFLLGDRADADLIEWLPGEPEVSESAPDPPGGTDPDGERRQPNDTSAEPAPRRAVQRSLGEYGRG